MEGSKETAQSVATEMTDKAKAMMPSLMQDMGVIMAHHEYAQHIRPLDGPAFGLRLVELLGSYDPDVVAVQLNLIGSHDAPRALTVLGGDRDALRLATLLQGTLPGAPCIYYGDEIGMAGGNDPANRASFPWDDSAWDHDLRTFVQAVIRLRAAEPAMRHGSTTAIGASGPAFAFERRLGDDALVVVVNAGTEPLELPIHIPGPAHGTMEPIELAGWGGWEADVSAIAIAGGEASVPIPARRGAVLRLRPA